MSHDDLDPNRRPGRRSTTFGEHVAREQYSEKTVRGVTVATIEDRYDEDAWIRSTLVVRNEP